MQVVSCATVMPVSDLQRAIRHYVDVLGFTKLFEYGGFDAGVERGAAKLHLNAKARAQPGSGSVSIIVDEVDRYFAEITAKGAKTEAPPKTYDYGMRDFSSTDPDGNQVGFGCEAPG